MKQPILELKSISKYFPGITALDQVSFDVYSGEVHMLLGENGAGKSTLMKVLCGAYHPEEGEIFYQGNPVKGKNIMTPELLEKIIKNLQCYLMI